jgi:hypothetical protein
MATAIRPRTVRTFGLVELIGPAGSGKSTMLRAIRATDERIHVDLSLWGQPRPALARAALALVPTAMRALGEGRPLGLAEAGVMIRMMALLRRVEQERQRRDGLFVLDEGPLFGFTWLRVFYGPPRGRARTTWHAAMRAAWTSHFAAIVQLDSPDRELARRIRDRVKPHLFKDASDDEIDHFTAVYRRAFAATLSDLDDPALPVVPVHTGAQHPVRDAQALVAALSERARGR